MKTLTKKEAIEQGYDHCGKINEEWQHLHKVEEMEEIDFINDDDWYLAEKDGHPFYFSKEQIAELLSDVIGDNESQNSGRDTEDIYEAIKAIDFSHTENQIQEVLDKFLVYRLTDIKLIP